MKKKLLWSLLFLGVFICMDRGLGAVINKGIECYYGLNQHSEVLLIGHSQLMLATDKEALEAGIGRKVSKYCREGVNVVDRYAMVRQYLSFPYSDSLEVVLYGVDQYLFTGGGLSKNSYKLFYPFMDEDNMNEYIKQSTDSYDYWLHKLVCTTRYSDVLLNSAWRGWKGNWSNYKEGMLNIASLEKQISKKQKQRIRFDQSLKETFEATLRMLTEKKIRVVLVNTPVARILNEYEPESYKEIIDYFQQLASSSSMIYYWDMNPDFSDQYDLFFDPIHLNPAGQKAINEQIIENFKKDFKVEL